MVLYFDLVKLAMMLACAVAVWRGELPWWVLAGLIGYYFTFPYQWLSPKMKRRAKEHEEQTKAAYAAQVAAGTPRRALNDLWDRPSGKGRDS